MPKIILNYIYESFKYILNKNIITHFRQDRASKTHPYLDISSG